MDAFVANSRFVAERVRKCYGRKSRVIYPPVDVDNFGLEEHKHDYYLAASRLVPYKRVDLIVDAFRHMPDKRLIVIGDGPMFKQLKASAPANVQLLGYQPHDVLKRHLQQAKAFVFAAEEDFGILPVEAQACGTPVVALWSRRLARNGRRRNDGILFLRTDTRGGCRSRPRLRDRAAARSARDSAPCPELFARAFSARNE